MTSEGDLLRRAADACDDFVLPEKDRDTIKLMALHILGKCGAQTTDVACELLIKKLDE